MRKDIIDEYIKNGGIKEDIQELIELTNNLEFELHSVKLIERKNEDPNKRRTSSIILPKTMQNQIYITYTKGHYYNTSYTIATLENHKLSKFGIKTSTDTNKTTINYFKGYIKPKNDGIYLFEYINNEQLNIKYYDEESFKKYFDSKKIIFLNNLTLDKIDFEPTFTTIIDFDINTSPFTAINNLFINPEIITNTTSKTYKKKN